MGWLISGPICIQGSCSNVVTCQFNLDISNQLQRFWEIEEIPFTTSLKNAEEEFCENNFVNNTYRLKNGRFCVKIPFHTSPETLGDSLKIAKQRFYNLEKRFKKQPSIKEQYIKFIHEYRDLGHLSSSCKMEPAYYLPHHPVLRDKSETTLIPGVR